MTLFKKFNKLLNKIDNMEYNKNYGFGNYNFEKSTLINNINYMTAVPYNYINSPINGSEFSDYELSMLLTILSYKKENLRKYDLCLLLQHLYENDNINDDYIDDQFNNEKQYNNLIEKIKNLMIYLENDYEDLEEKIKNKLIIQVEKLLIEIKENKDFNKIVLDYYIKNVILKTFFKISKTRYNISMIDIYNNLITKNKVSFSGTVNFINPSKTICNILNKPNENKSLLECQIYEYQQDEKISGAIEASIYGITTQEPII